MPTVKTTPEFEQKYDRHQTPLFEDLGGPYRQIQINALKELDPNKTYVWVADYSYEYETGGAIIAVCHFLFDAVNRLREWYKIEQTGDFFTVEQIEVE